MQLERHVDVCNKTKTMAQDRVCLDRRARTYLKKTCNIEKNEAINFRLLIDFLEVLGFSHEMSTLLKKGAIRNTRLLLNYYQLTVSIIIIIVL